MYNFLMFLVHHPFLVIFTYLYMTYFFTQWINSGLNKLGEFIFKSASSLLNSFLDLFIMDK